MTNSACKGITPDDPRFAELDAFIQDGRASADFLIAVLHKAQQLFGFLPEEVQRHVAAALHVPPSEVYGVVTFYNFFSLTPVGKYPINVCMGTACYVQGAGRILSLLEKELGIQPGQVTPDGLFSLEVCRCLGACGLAPVVTVGGEVHGKLTESDALKLVAELRERASAEQAEAGAAVATVGGDSQ